MYLAYSLLLTLAFLILLPYFLFDAIKTGKYVAAFRERFGKLAPLNTGGKPVVWLHCVSVGESQAARPLVKEIRQRFPGHLLVISTITLTGQNLAHEIFRNDAAKIFYFPFDWRWTVRRALAAINPSAVLVMETEIWPRFLKECRAAKVPVAIVNGRLSLQSFRKYRWIKRFISRVINCLHLAVMQTEVDAERIHMLGLPRSKITVSGNLKFDAGRMPGENSLPTEFRQRFKLTTERPLILAASTHAPEERLVLEAFRGLRGATLAPRLLIAPRHPERFAEVASLLATSGLTWVSRRSTISALDRQCDVIFLDTIGELQALYPLATIVFVGGSISKSGGHNILEPAAVGAPIVTGPYTHNFDAIVKAFVMERAIIQLSSLSDDELQTELKGVFAELLADSSLREELGRRAQTLVEQNLGATQRTLALLDAMISSQHTSNRTPNAVSGGPVYTA